MILGLDIGGAHLKAAHADGRVLVRPFELWKHPGRLAAELAALADRFAPCDGLAVTMTGELCDCFADKRQGVNAILDAVTAAAGPRPVGVWMTEGRFVGVDLARSEALRVAAANWHALATFVGRYAPAGPALLVDVGSTTTDVVPLRDGRPVNRGRTDPERLRCRELVYTGVRRTPVCALLGADGAAEWFATTRDVYLVLGLVPEVAADHDTADGRPATRSAARERLARMLCADRETCDPEEIDRLAREVARRQRDWVRAAVREVGRGPVPTIILAGEGEFLARQAIAEESELESCRVLSLAEELGADLSRAACAYALARLAAERDFEEG